MTKGDYATGRGANRGGDRDQNFGGRQNVFEKAFDFYKQYSPLGIVTRGITNLFGGPKTGFSTQGAPYGNVPGSLRGRDITATDDDNDRGGGDGIPLYAQLGFPSQAAYMASLQRAGLPAAVQPQQTLDLNRIAYRFMADGGFLDDEDEPRQAYGLGSIVRKITRPIKKVVKKATKAVKKVTKSPIGRLAIAVAAPYALGPAMANAKILAGLSAAQKAAVISGATTGITQLASGEDLDLKDIALSAAIGGTSAKFFPPGGSSRAVSQAPRGPGELGLTTRGPIGTPGFKPSLVDEVALTGGRTFTGPKELGLTAQRAAKESALAQSLKPTAFTGADKLREARSVLSTLTPTPEKTGILQTLSDKITGNKLGNLLLGSKDGGISPMKSILLASGLAGLAAKKDFEEEEFKDEDRGPGIDIEAIRRRPFDYMAPRFAGSQFDFYAADGGRIGYEEAGAVLSEKEMKKLAKSPLYKGFKTMYSVDPGLAKENDSFKDKFSQFEQLFKKGYQEGGDVEPVAKKTMPLLDMGGKEMDLRDNGGFVPIGRMEKADDVPERRRSYV